MMIRCIKRSDARMFVFTVSPFGCWILNGGTQMTDLTRISFSYLSPEKMNSYDGLKEHLNVNSHAQKSHPKGHTKH